MRTTLSCCSLLCAGALLLACTNPGGHTAAGAPAVAEAAPLRAEDAYLLGRGEHLAYRYDAARAFYEAALARDPGHVKARNGLATLYAEKGEFARAIRLWQAMTQEAAGGGQDSAFLFSNLGYAHFLNGEFEQALAALEKACLLDPLNERAWRHLGEALAKVGQHERAAQMAMQASALRTHDFKSDYAVAERAGVPAIDSAVKAGGPVLAQEPQWDRTEVRQDGAGVFVVQRVSARPAPLPAAPATVAAAAQTQAQARPARALLEIRNGNGVTGMARSLAGTMEEGALRVVRLSNQKGFGVRQTRIEYQPEFRVAAERLAERFGAARVVAVGDIGRADLRLVIGRDLVPATAPPVAIAARRRQGPAAG
ncbi:tetratricopeptide repeat protein [Massilia sp. CCM 9210]|uniref:LytR C-terminal domain-containing protein n=1 Tax=Massilia scottii TaxID=3057166 RepID=UPI0027967050|nr:LytR C-terminal domain-containing protein [Massilia sp. CCM 9210]MDQ1814739.1 tetratricopeptide repeat protein [Massilia sp. CCM 9210]